MSKPWWKPPRAAQERTNQTSPYIVNCKRSNAFTFSVTLLPSRLAVSVAHCVRKAHALPIQANVLRCMLSAVCISRAFANTHKIAIMYEQNVMLPENTLQQFSNTYSMHVQHSISKESLNYRTIVLFSLALCRSFFLSVAFSLLVVLSVSLCVWMLVVYNTQAQRCHCERTRVCVCMCVLASRSANAQQLRKRLVSLHIWSMAVSLAADIAWNSCKFIETSNLPIFVLIFPRFFCGYRHTHTHARAIRVCACIFRVRLSLRIQIKLVLYVNCDLRVLEILSFDFLFRFRHEKKNINYRKSIFCELW